MVVIKTSMDSLRDSERKMEKQVIDKGMIILLKKKKSMQYTNVI